MNEDNYVVYRHTSPSGKVYIGITCQIPEKRWKNGNGYKNSIKFYSAIQKYGWDNLKHEILFSGLNEISAKLIEEDLIYYYKKQNKSYNITDGGEGTRGVSPSEETRKKMSDAKKGKPSNRKGIILSEETRKKISDSNKGKIYSEETRKKISDSNKGITRSEETKLKISKANEKPVNQFSLDDILIATYNSMSEAEKLTSINIGGISRCCKGNRKTAGGYIWRYNI